LDNNINIITTESAENLRQMILSEDENDLELATRILYNRDKNNLESEQNYVNLLNSLTGDKGEVAKIYILGQMVKYIAQDFNIDKQE
jgi:FixJ family two-component response regulator